MRWFTPPPQRTAYFSSARRPGVVLRVSRTRAPVPSSASTQRCVSVATPDRWHSRLSAVRSAVRSRRVGAVTRAISVPGSTTDPSATSCSNWLAVDPHTISITAAATGRPAITPCARAPNVAVLTRSSGIVATDVTSTPSARSSSSATAISRATAAASNPAPSSIAVVAADNGCSSVTADSIMCGPAGDVERSHRVERDVEMRQPIGVGRRDSRSGGDNPGSRCVPGRRRPPRPRP